MGKRVKLFDLDNDVQAVIAKTTDSETDKPAITCTFYDTIGDDAYVEGKITAGYDTEAERDQQFNEQCAEKLQGLYESVSKNWIF